MSNKAVDDINLEELSRDELIAQIRLERKGNKKRIKKIKRYNADTEIALAAAIEQREEAYEQLNDADNAIMSLVENVLVEKGLPVLALQS